MSIVVMLMAVHLLYKVKTGIYFFESEWTSGDLLAFVGTINLFLLVWFFVIITDIRRELRVANQKNDELTKTLLKLTTETPTNEAPEENGSVVSVKNDGKYKILPSHVDCPECGASVNATPCPNCGYPIKQESKDK